MSALTDRDANAQMNNPQPQMEGKKMAAMGGENKKQTLEQRIAEQNINGKQSGGAYISPSDAILSPASQKLAGFKQRQINKQNSKNPTARSLFSRTASTISSGSLEDAEDTPAKQQ